MSPGLVQHLAAWPIATLWFANASWLGWVAAAALVTGGWILWSYRAGPRGRWGLACGFLKAVGVAVLALCLLEPMWTRLQPRTGANLFALVADNSQGLQLLDAGADMSRGAQLRTWLDGDWRTALDKQFSVRRFTFDRRLRDVREEYQLSFDGTASSLGEALRSLRDRFAGRPLAGILLFTDGIATDGPTRPEDLAGLPPVYPVAVGDDAPVRDLAIDRARVTETAFEDAPVTIQADLTVRGLSGRSADVYVEDAVGRVVRQKTLAIRSEEESLSVRFQLRPDEPGLTFYRLRAATATAESAVEEATLLNNQRVVAVNRDRGPYRILYVGGRPNWEYKFLNRALDGDDELQLVALIRVAVREPKFEFRGRAGETSNPLFRGFDDQSREEAERYDQPVLNRLNTRDEVELRGGFPRTAEELYAYDAVVIDDVEADFFQPDQALLLRQFVSLRGGGVLMLGGSETFQQGGYDRSPIGDMLPVYVARESGGSRGIPGPLKFRLEREGWLQPWARLRDNETAERRRLEQMPPFQVLNPVRAAKPGAGVVASVVDEDERSYPALVTQRVGAGRTAALLVGDLWRWGMQGATARDDMNKAWRQLARWLVSDVPGRIDIQVEETPASGPGGVRLVTRVRDEEFQPADDVDLDLRVRAVMAMDAGAGDTVVRLQPDPAPDQAGQFLAAYSPRVSGGYQASVVVTNRVGEEVGRADVGWSVDLAAEEWRSLRPEPERLEDIARRTGGEMVPADQLPAFVRSLPTRAAPVMEPFTTPLWHSPFLFLFALLCFTTEWGIRRWKGAA